MKSMYTKVSLPNGAKKCQKCTFNVAHISLLLLLFFFFKYIYPLAMFVIHAHLSTVDSLIEFPWHTTIHFIKFLCLQLYHVSMSSNFWTANLNQIAYRISSVEQKLCFFPSFLANWDRQEPGYWYSNMYALHECSIVCKVSLVDHKPDVNESNVPIYHRTNGFGISKQVSAQVGLYVWAMVTV